MHYDLLIRGGVCVLPWGEEDADVGVIDGRIAAIGAFNGDTAAEVFDAAGLHVLPGLIDSHVHLRDPGLHAVREAAGGRPVMGIAEWGLLRALTLGERFGIIALSPASVQRQQRYVRQMGLQDRYAGSWPVGASAAETAGEAVRERLAEAGKNLTTRFGADVIVLGCAGMAGHRRALQDLIGRPVVEPTQQAVAAAIGALLLADS